MSINKKEFINSIKKGVGVPDNYSDNTSSRSKLGLMTSQVMRPITKPRMPIRPMPSPKMPMPFLKKPILKTPSPKMPMPFLKKPILKTPSSKMPMPILKRPGPMAEYK